MATFTITTDTNMDTLTTKAGGDTYNVNGAVLTIDSDTRWAKNASASIGPFGNITISSTLGGSVIIDGTKVWLLPYDNGTGVVPATGDTVTGAGGATGELIGVWTAINTTPTAAGAAMPATGFIKLKDKTTTFTDNEALTATGMTADVNSSTGGYRGWIEIVGQELLAMNVPRLGAGSICTGDWFYLDDTTGSAGQILQAPNSGGTNSYYPAVSIETGVGTGVYEEYPAILASGSNSWGPTYMGTDARCKFVEMLDSGRFRIGSDGSNNVGYVPTAGCRVRVPNIIWMNTTSADRTVNVVPNATFTTRYDFITTSGGSIDWDKVMGNFYMPFATAYSISLKNVYYLDAAVITECSTEAILENVIQGNYSHSNTTPITINSCSQGIRLVNCNFGKTLFSGAGYCAYFYVSFGITIEGGIYGMRSPKLAATAFAIGFFAGIGISVTDITTFSGPIYVTGGAKDVHINGVTYADTLVGSALATNATRIIHVVTAYNVLVENLYTFPGITDVAPVQNIIYLNLAEGVIIRNIGTYASPFNTNTTNTTVYPIQDGGSCKNITIKRVYTTGSASTPIVYSRTTTGVLVENSFIDYSKSQALWSQNMQVKGCGFTNYTTNTTAVFGTHWYDFFNSTTTGGIAITCNEKTIEEPSASSYTITGGTPEFNSLSNVRMAGITDEIIFEMQYFAIGHTAFQNSAPIITGTSTSNLDFAYDINVNDGNGFTGSYKSLTAANLSAETIDATLGVKLRLKVSVNTAASTTLLSNVNILTSSTTTTQAYQYPLENYTYTISGLVTGTKVAIKNSGTETLFVPIMTESGGEVSFDFSSDQSGDSVDIAILAAGYVYQFTTEVLPSESANVSINQIVDIVYDNTETALSTFNGSTHKIVMDAGSTEYNVVGTYTAFVDWSMLSDNLKYDFAFNVAGGNDINVVAGTSIPKYTFLINGWSAAPDEASHTLTVTQGILLVSGGGNPFDNTVGKYTVQISYQQPVQAITVATSGSSITPAQVADAVWDEVLSGHLTTGTTGKKLNDNLTQNNFLGLK